MTHEPDHPERDPALDSAWREHSAELPSAAMDDAILAAAHRAVKSAPRDVGKPAAEATSPQRWWMPLAAAATIGAVALGILQTMPQQEIVTTPSVSDTPKRAPERAAADSVAPPPPPASAPPATAPAMAPAKPMAKVATPTPPAVTSAMDSAVPAPLATAPQPFPAERKAESAESDVKDRARAASKLATAPDAATAAPAAAAPTPQAARSDVRQRNEATPSAPTAAGAVALGKTAASLEAPALSAADIDAWIARIRKLHDEGKVTDAAKELVALRAAVPDADSRLPREMRAWAATVKP
jgi:hypothetical protein